MMSVRPAVPRWLARRPGDPDLPPRPGDPELPLTRRAMACWARFRDARDDAGRETLVRHAGLTDAEQEALALLLARYVAWRARFAVGGTIDRAAVAQFIDGLTLVDERSLPDLVRGVLGDNCIQHAAMTKLLRLVLAERPQRACADRPRYPQHSIQENPMPASTAPRIVPLNGAEDTRMPYVSRESQVLAAVRALAIDPMEDKPRGTVLLKIADDLGISTAYVDQIIYAWRKKQRQTALNASPPHPETWPDSGHIPHVPREASVPEPADETPAASADAGDVPAPAADTPPETADGWSLIEALREVPRAWEQASEQWAVLPICAKVEWLRRHADERDRALHEARTLAEIIADYQQHLLAAMDGEPELSMVDDDDCDGTEKAAAACIRRLRTELADLRRAPLPIPVREQSAPERPVNVAVFGREIQRGEPLTEAQQRKTLEWALPDKDVPLRAHLEMLTHAAELVALTLHRGAVR